MAQIQDTRIITSEAEKAARIARACITAQKAAAELSATKQAHQFQELRTWAEELFDKATLR